MQTFNGVGRIYDATQLQRICIEGDQIVPVFFPASNGAGVVLSPLFFQQQKLLQCRLGVHGAVDPFQVAGKLLDMFITDEAATGSNLMYDAPLHLRLRHCRHEVAKMDNM